MGRRGSGGAEAAAAGVEAAAAARRRRRRRGCGGALPQDAAPCLRLAHDDARHPPPRAAERPRRRRPHARRRARRRGVRRGARARSARSSAARRRRLVEGHPVHDGWCYFYSTSLASARLTYTSAHTTQSAWWRRHASAAVRQYCTSDDRSPNRQLARRRAAPRLTEQPRAFPPSRRPTRAPASRARRLAGGAARVRG